MPVLHRQPFCAQCRGYYRNTAGSGFQDLEPCSRLEHQRDQGDVAMTQIGQDRGDFPLDDHLRALNVFQNSVGSIADDIEPDLRNGSAHQRQNIVIIHLAALAMGLVGE